MDFIKWLHFYAQTSYLIGHTLYNLNDIENGILRGNRQSPVPFTSIPFPIRDERLKLILPCDPRIHFSINCGVLSCPPIAVYSFEEERLNQELTRATKSFINTDVVIDTVNNKICLSSIFKWYYHDFGSTDMQLIEWILQYANEQVIRDVQAHLQRNSGRPCLSYKPYDFSWNHT